MTRWAHLFPSRTQKLSTAVMTIPGEPGKIIRCRAFFVYGVFSLIYAPTFDKNRGY